MFDEQKLFPEISAAICTLDPWSLWINDLFSFYKESKDRHDHMSLINNYCHVGQLTVNEAFENLTSKTLQVTKEIMTVFKDKDPRVLNSVLAFMNGYVTFHLTARRYRIRELYDQADMEHEVGRKFRLYFESAQRAALVDPSELSVPALDWPVGAI